MAARGNRQGQKRKQAKFQRRARQCRERLRRLGNSLELALHLTSIQRIGLQFKP
jgi:hypothetical protein